MLIARQFAVTASSMALVLAVMSCTRPDAPSAPTDPSLAQVSVADTAGRYIVLLKGAPRRDRGERRALALSASRALRHEYQFALNGFAADLSAEHVRFLRSHPLVERIEVDALMQLQDTRINVGWGLGRIDNRWTPTLDHQFTSTLTGQGVNIYIVDSGVDIAHPEFGGRAHAAWTYDAARPAGLDCRDHGTGVASVAAGSTIGVATQATIWSVRVNGCNDDIWVSDMTAGVDWVTGNHIAPAVMNVSMGATNLHDDIFPGSVNTAVKNAKNAGVFVVVAAGNGNTDACSWAPANAMEVVTVGATDSTGWRSTNWPNGQGSNWGGCVDLFAPGSNITAARASINGGGVWPIYSGTSFAAPFVAGVGALLRQQYPNDTPDQLAKMITDGAMDFVHNSNSSNHYLLYSQLPVAPYVRISGPSAVPAGALCQWTAEAKGGRGPFTYQWHGLLSGSGPAISGSLWQTGDLNVTIYDTSLGLYAGIGLWIDVDGSGPPQDDCPW